MMRLSIKLWGGLMAGVLLVGLPGGVMGLDGVVVAQTVEERQTEADRLFEEGNQLYDEQDFEGAFERWQQALTLYREVGDRPGEVDALRKIGNYYRTINDHEQVASFTQQSLDLAREIGYRLGEANALNNLGTGYSRLEDEKKAIEFYQQALVIHQELGDFGWEAANILDNLGRAYLILQEYEKMIEFYNQSLIIHREIGDRQREAIAFGNLGVAYHFLGQYERAIAFHEQSLEINREIGDRQREANSLGNLGVDYNALGQYERAIAFYEQWLEIAQEIGDRPGEANSLGNLGVAYNALGQYERAIAFFEQSLEIAREIGDRQGEAVTLGNLGGAYNALGQYERAIAFHEQSLEINREIGDRQGEADFLGNLGMAYNALGQYERAITFYEQSLEISREIDDRPGEANSLGNLGNAYRNLGQYEQAIAFHEQSLEIKRKIGDRPGEANSLGNLGMAYNVLGQYERAITFHEQFLEIAQEIGDRPWEAYSLGNLGVAYHFLGQYERAITFHEQSLEINREIGYRPGEAYSLRNMGDTYIFLGRHEQALDFYEQSLDILQEIGDRREEADTLVLMSRLYGLLEVSHQFDNFNSQQSSGENIFSDNLKQAIEFREQALSIYRDIGDYQNQVNVLNTLVIIALDHDAKLDFLQRLIELHQQQLALVRESQGKKYEEANVLSELGRTYVFLEEHTKASEFYRQSIFLFREIGDRTAEIKVLKRAGEQYYLAFQYNEALYFYGEYLRVAQDIDNPAEMVQALQLIGDTHHKILKFETAIGFYQQALTIAQESGFSIQEITPMFEKILGLYDRLRLSSSDRTTLYVSKVQTIRQFIEIQKNHIEILRESGDQHQEAEILYSIGSAYRDVEEYEDAISYYEESIYLSVSLGDLISQSKSQRQLCIIYEKHGNYDDIIRCYKEIFSTYREMGDRWLEAETLDKLGAIYRNAGQYEQSIESYQNALKITREIGVSLRTGKRVETMTFTFNPLLANRAREMTYLMDLAKTYTEFKQYDLSIETYRDAFEIAKETDNPRTQASILREMALIYQQLGQHEAAVTLNQQALEITEGYANAQEIDFFGLTLQVPDVVRDYRQEEVHLRTFELGSLNALYSDYGEAIQATQNSLEVAREIGDREKEAASLGNLGSIYGLLGRYDKAADFLQQSLEIAQQIDDQDEIANVLNDFGVIARSSGQYEKAIALLDQSLIIWQAQGDLLGQASAFLNLGLVYSDIGQYEQAISDLQQALKLSQEINSRYGEAHSLGNLGLAFNQLGQYEQAIEFHQKALSIARELGDRRGESFALNNLGLTLFELRRYSEAEQSLLTAVKVHESIRSDLDGNDSNKISIFEEQSRTYRTLQQAQIAQNKTIAALETAERGRARAFVELLHRRLNPDDPNATIQPPNLAQIQQIAEQQNATLVEYSIIYDNFDLDDKPGKETWRESALYIWVIAPTGEVTFRQVDLTPLWRDDDLRLDDLVRFTRDSLGVRGLDLRSLNRDLVAAVDRDQFQRNLYTEAQLLTKLHEILVAPIADLLPTNPEDRVVFLPQSSLFLVPFPALMDANGDYLIEKHTILTAPSIQTLELTRSQKETQGGGQGALIVGNPTMPSVAPDFGETPRPLSKLPGAETEALEIAQLLNTQAFTGNTATKSAMVAQMQNAEIIHLATHGLLDDIRGMGSAIALAPDSNFEAQPGAVNGLLTAEEIFDMDLKADLVVLSACDTGRGRITGDGVVGLSRSFISAGVPTVLVSLWQVPDAPTAALMTRFYQQRESLGDNAQALRQAMLQTMQTHPEPRNWAAFTLIGEAD